MGGGNRTWVTLRARWRGVLVVALLVVAFLALLGTGVVVAEESSPSELFDQRILPIFRSPNPSSCVQCHLAGVDLKNYILPSSDATFASLRDQGLIDIEQPQASKILQFIERGADDLDDGARLIHQQTRDAELGAFREWIVASCADARMVSLPAASELARPSVPESAIRFTRRDRLVDSFVRKIWSQRMRCFPCHTPHEIDPENPRHKVAAKKQREMEAKYDAETLERLALFRATPDETMQAMIEASKHQDSNRLPLLDFDDPARSLLILKPTARLPKKSSDGEFEPPSYVDPVTHMGGLKMHVNDHSYKAFVSWISDYAASVNGDYDDGEDFPADNWGPSKMVVRIKQIPTEWKVGTTAQMTVHAWPQDAPDYTAKPLAFGQGTITPRRMINGVLFRFLNSDVGVKDEKADLEPDSDKANDARLARGRYVVRVFLDSNDKISREPTAFLTEEDFVATAVLEDARWRDGFRGAEVIQKLEVAE